MLLTYSGKVKECNHKKCKYWSCCLVGHKILTLPDCINLEYDRKSKKRKKC